MVLNDFCLTIPASNCGDCPLWTGWVGAVERGVRPVEWVGVAVEWVGVAVEWVGGAALF